MGYTYNRKASSDTTRRLEQMFGTVLKSGNVDQLLKEEAKMVREYVAGMKQLNEEIAALEGVITKIQQGGAHGNELPEPIFGEAWPTQREAVAKIHGALEGLQKAKLAAQRAAYETEMWVADQVTNIEGVASKRVLFPWPEIR